MLTKTLPVEPTFMSPSTPDENTDAAADILAEGVESCNPGMIREAVARTHPAI